MQRKPIHVLPYGDSGVGKSTFAATFPKPMLVFSWDPHGKDLPYQKGAESVSELLTYDIGTAAGVSKIVYRDVIHKEGPIRIEYYHDQNIDSPEAFHLFRWRLAVFQAEYNIWATVVCDSLTFMELSARKLEEKVLNPMTKFAKGTDTRQWFAGSTDSLEEMVVWRFASLPMNVITICHIDERRNDVSGEILRGPSAPGRLNKRGLLNAAYQEQYHLYTVRDESGKRLYQLQAQNRDGWVATSQINCPDPAYPSYEGIWQGGGA